MPTNICIWPETDEDGEYPSIFNRTFIWPAKGDRLFRAGNWERSVDFSDQRISRFIDIWNGYMEAGKRLVEECERDPRANQHLIYPMLYCYRHGLELAMKWVIWMMAAWLALIVPITGIMIFGTYGLVVRRLSLKSGQTTRMGRSMQ